MSNISIAPEGKNVRTLISAAIIQNNPEYLMKELPLAKELNLQAYHYNTVNRDDPHVINRTAADLTMQFIDALGTNPRVDVIFDIENYNMTTDVDYCISKFRMAENKATMLWGFETVESIGGDAYIAIANIGIEKLKGTGIESWLDCGLIYRLSGNSQRRIDACAKIAGATAERQYTQPEDRFTINADMATNFANFKTYFDVTVPHEWVDKSNPNSCVSRMPNLKIANVQFHDEGYGKNESIVHYITGKPLGNWVNGKFAILALRNTENVNYMCYMSNQELIDGVKPNPVYFDIKRISPLFRYKKVMPLTITGVAGLDGLAFSNPPLDGGRDYAMLITNETGTEYNLRQEEIISLWGGKIVGTIKRDTGYGKNGWDNIDTTNEVITTDTSFLIRRNSTTVFYFSVHK